ncbi:MAG: hypothetical protein AAF716_17840 [Cyanobacteria bacterium P01_D01_bin.1]
MINNSSNRATSAKSKRKSDVRDDDLSQRSNRQPSTGNSAQPNTDSQPTGASESSYSESSHQDFSAEEKFELMSAYLDDEVSEQERVLVESWLESDPQLLSSYQQQLKLREAVQELGLDLFD